MQVRNLGVFCPRKVEKHLVAIEANHDSLWPDRSCNAGGNRAGTAADVQNGKSWSQQLSKAPVVPLKSSPPEDTGRGPV